MGDEYLWNREGEPDAELARLEDVLRPLGCKPKAIDFRAPRRERERARARWLVWAVAAAAAIATTAVGWRLRSTRLPAESSWTVSLNGSAPRSVRKGQVIETGERVQARLNSDFVGEVELAADSRLRVVESTQREQRLALQRGTLHAFIWAPAREFIVETPGARTVDLGCAYTLHVAPDGDGLLTVEAGWVAFQWRAFEAFIPAGAACSTRAGSGPGTPHFLDAPTNLQMKLARFDRDGDAASLSEVLHLARPRDALTLWHLLARTRGEERRRVFERFTGLVTLPPSVTEEKILAGDASAMDAAWNALGFGNTDWWRGWKRPW